MRRTQQHHHTSASTRALLVRPRREACWAKSSRVSRRGTECQARTSWPFGQGGCCLVLVIQSTRDFMLTKPLIPSFYADRAANALVGGILYQLAWTALGWLNLAEDEVLLVEGDEDVVKALVDDQGNIVELTQQQIKHLEDNVTARSPAVHETIFAFLCSFHLHALEGRRCRFIFTSTAKQGDQKVSSDGDSTQYKAQLTEDVLVLWRALHGASPGPAQTEELIKNVRALIDGYGSSAASGQGKGKGRDPSITSARMLAAAGYLDDHNGWADFFGSVEWMLDQVDSGDLFQQVVARLDADPRRNGLPATLVAMRLIYEVAVVGAQKSLGGRTLSRSDLDGLLQSTADELTEWSKARHADHILGWYHRVERLEKGLTLLQGQVALLSDGTDEAPAELTARYRDWLSRTTETFHVLGIHAPVPLREGWDVAARLRDGTYNASLLLESDARRLVVVGAAGAGKSIVMQRLANWATADGQVAICLSLPALAAALQGEAPVGVALARVVAEESALREDDARRLIRSATVLLLDGLDRCGADAATVVKKVEAFAKNLPAARLVISTRPDFASLLPSDFEAAELLPLESFKVSDAVAKMLRAIGESDDGVRVALANLPQVQGSAPLELTSLHVVLITHLARDRYALLSRAKLYGAVLETLRDRPLSGSRPLDERVFAAQVLGAAALCLCQFPGRSRREVVAEVSKSLAGPTQEDAERVESALDFWEKVAVLHRTRIGGLEGVEFLHEMVRDFAAAQRIVKFQPAARAAWFSEHARDFGALSTFVVELGGPSAIDELVIALADHVDDAELLVTALSYCPDAASSTVHRVVALIGRAVVSTRPLLAQRVSEAARTVVARAPTEFAKVCLPALQSPQEWCVLATLCLLTALPEHLAPVDEILDHLERRVLEGVDDAGVDVIWPMWNAFVVPAVELVIKRGRSQRLDTLLEKLVMGGSRISLNTSIALRLRLRGWGYGELLERRDAQWQAQNIRSSWDRDAFEGDRAFLTLLEQTFEGTAVADTCQDDFPSLGRLTAALGHNEGLPGEWSSYFFLGCGTAVREVVKGVTHAAGIAPADLLAEVKAARERLVPESLAPGAWHNPLLALTLKTPRSPEWARTSALRLSLDSLFDVLRSRSPVLACAAAELILNHGEQAEVQSRAAAELKGGTNYVAHLLGGSAESLWGGRARDILLDSLSAGVTDSNAPLLPILATLDPIGSEVAAMVVSQLSARSAPLLAAVRASKKLTDPPVVEMRSAFERYANGDDRTRASFSGTRHYPGDAGAELFDALITLGALDFTALAELTNKAAIRTKAMHALVAGAARSKERFQELLHGLHAGQFAFDLLADVFELPDNQKAPHSAELLGFHDFPEESVRVLVMLELGGAAWLPRETARATLRAHLDDVSPAVRAAAERGLREHRASGFEKITLRARLQRTRARPLA